MRLIDTSNWKDWSQGASSGLRSGMVIIPQVFLRNYRRLKLSESEAMLLMQLMTFQQVDHKDFPTMEEIQEVMGGTAQSVAEVLQRLIKDGFLSIDEELDQSHGLHIERYNLSGLYDKLGQCLASDAKKKVSKPAVPEQERNLFSIMEKEFGRPLTPMECETISNWMDEDHYPQDLILLALKEAVFAGKVHFRYIDRILLEWSRNRIRTVQDAKAYIQKFHSGNRGSL